MPGLLPLRENARERASTALLVFAVCNPLIHHERPENQQVATKKRSKFLHKIVPLSLPLVREHYAAFLAFDAQASGFKTEDSCPGFP